MPISLLGTSFAAQLGLAGAYYFGHTGGYNSHDSYAPVEYKVVEKERLAHTDAGRSLGTSWGGLEAKLNASLATSRPLYEAEHPLLAANKLSLSGWFELSPVSLNLGANTAWELVSFAKLNVGGTVGTGWNAVIANGLGRNLASESQVRKEPFSGVVSRFWMEPALQFDLAALAPGDWNHVVAYLAESREYKSYSAVDSNTAWEFENDGGSNLNGWKRNRTYLVGYRPPLRLNMIAFLATSEKSISHANDSPMAAKGWGSDFETWTFGPTLGWKLSDSSNLTTLLQWSRERGYTDNTIGNRHFTRRVYNRAVTHLHRLALNWKQDL
jgi:hypothetical protein